MQHRPGEANHSAHDWGIAVDVQLRDADAMGKMAAVFDRHGFIWACEGMDCETVHFEYRPEVVGYARLRQSQQP